jgi:hypothetical protein
MEQRTPYQRRLASRAFRLHAQPDRLRWWGSQRVNVLRHLFDQIEPLPATAEWRLIGAQDPVYLYRPTNAWHVPHSEIERGPCLLSLAMWRWDCNPREASEALTVICEGA